MKKSVGTGRPSKGPIRISHLGSTAGNNDGQARPSLCMSTSRIPVKSGRPSHDRNSQLALRPSRSTFSDSSRKTAVHRSRSSAAASGRTLATPCRSNSIGKGSQTPHFGSQRRSQSAHSPHTPKIFGAISGKKADSRLINDKEFQKRAMVNVYNFFLEHPALSQTCPKPGTRSIMIKSFYELVAHLLGNIYPHATINGSNYVTEIPLLMKMLNYPGNLSSSWLKSANTMHSWPHVVALLHWLVDLVKPLDEGNDFLEDDKECELLAAEEIFIYNEMLFGMWNDANDKGCSRLNEELLSLVLQRSGFDDLQMESMQSEVEKLEADCNHPKELAAIAEEQDREEQCKKAEIKVKKLQDTIDFKSREIKTIEEDINTESDYQATLSKKKPLLLKQLDDVKQIVATQKMSKLIVEKMYREWDVIDTAFEQKRKYKESIEKLAYDLNLKSTSYQLKLEKWSRDYNATIFTMGLDNPEQVHINIQVQHVSAPEDWLNKEQTFQSVVNAAKSMLDIRAKRKLSLERQVQDQHDELAKYQDNLHDLCAKETALKSQAKKMSVEYKRQEESLHEIINSLEADIQDKLKSDCNSSELQAELQRTKGRASQCKRECGEFQTRAVKSVAYYEDYCKKALEKIYADMVHPDIVFLREYNESN